MNLLEKNLTTGAKIKNKNEEKREKVKALMEYRRQFRGRCCKCGTYGHNPNETKCLECKEEQQNENDEKEESDCKLVVCFHCGKKGHKIENCKKQ